MLWLASTSVCLLQFLFTRCWVDGWDVRPAGTEMWFACINLICTVSQTKSSTLCWALFLMLYYTWKRTSQDSNGAGFKKKKTTDESLMTHERLEMMRVSAHCRYFSLFLGLNCKFACVKHSGKKKKHNFSIWKKKSQLNVLLFLLIC